MDSTAPLTLRVFLAGVPAFFLFGGGRGDAQTVTPPVVPTPPLSASERRLSLRSSETMDLRSPPFQCWLDSTSLHRPVSERDLDFGIRVYQTIRKRPQDPPLNAN